MCSRSDVVWYSLIALVWSVARVLAYSERSRATDCEDAPPLAASGFVPPSTYAWMAALANALRALLSAAWADATAAWAWARWA